MRINTGINVWHFPFLLPRSLQAVLRNDTPRGMAPPQRAARGAPPARHATATTTPTQYLTELFQINVADSHVVTDLLHTEDSRGVNSTVTIRMTRQAARLLLSSKAYILSGTTGRFLLDFILKYI